MILDNPNSFSNLKTAVGFSGYAPWILRKCTLEKVVNLPNICGLRDASASKNWLTLSSQRHGRINAFSNSQIIRCHTVMALELVIIGFLLGIHSLMSTGVILVFPLSSWIGLIWLLLFTSVYFWEFVWTHGWGNVIKIYILLNLICILIVVRDAILKKFEKNLFKNYIWIFITVQNYILKKYDEIFSSTRYIFSLFFITIS